MAGPALSKIEQSILAILAEHPAPEVSGRDLRRLVQALGFRRTAPAFYFTMMSLEDKGLVRSREEVRWVEGLELRDCYYGLSTTG